MLINYVDLARRLIGRSVKNDAQMPWAYQFANPNGRPYHDDWTVWPFTRIKRMDTTFMLPMPMKLVWSKGAVLPRWAPWQENYSGGTAPNAKIRRALPGTEAYARNILYEIEVYDPVLPVGQAAVYAVWLDNEWRPCYYTSTQTLFGRRLYTNRGVKPDVTYGDFMWNYPEMSLTYNKISP